MVVVVVVVVVVEIVVVGGRVAGGIPMAIMLHMLNSSLQMLSGLRLCLAHPM